MRTVLIVLFDGVQSLDVTGPLEVFAGANRWQSGRDPDSPDGPAYRIRTASLGGRPVRTSSGPVTSRLCTPSNRTISTVRMHLSVSPAARWQQ